MKVFCINKRCHRQYNCQKTWLINGLFSKLILLFSACLLLNACVSFEEPPAPYDAQLYVLVDQRNGLDIASLLAADGNEEQSPLKQSPLKQSPLNWKQYHHGDSSPGYTDATVWLKLKLRNPSNSSFSLYWIIADSFIDHIQRFDIVNGAIFDMPSVGLKHSITNRDVIHRYPVFFVDLPAQSERVSYFLVRSHSAITLGNSLMTIARFEAMDRGLAYRVIAFSAIVLSMVVYNLLLFFGTREKSYLFYCYNMFTLWLLLVTVEGWHFEFFHYNEWVKTYLFDIIMFNFGGSCLLFVRSFLNTRQNMPVIHRWIRGFMWLLFALAGTSFFYQSSIIEQIGVISLLLVIVIAMSLGVLALYRGLKMARLFCAGWALIWAGGIMAVLGATGITSSFLFFIEWVRAAHVGEVLLMSLALADRLYVIKNQTLKAQRRAQIELEEQVNQRTRELQQANRQLSELSRRDGLTGVMNRRFFDEVLTEEVERSCRYGQPLSLLLVDIDHFKSINDEHGHQQGDDVIISVAQQLKALASRPADVVARYGGEEFAVLLPGTDLSGASTLAETMRDMIEKTHYQNMQREVTISVGVAALVCDNLSETQTLVRYADNALYRAKRAGRNRVENADPADLKK